MHDAPFYLLFVSLALWFFSVTDVLRISLTFSPTYATDVGGSLSTLASSSVPDLDNNNISERPLEDIAPRVATALYCGERCSITRRHQDAKALVLAAVIAIVIRFPLENLLFFGSGTK